MSCWTTGTRYAYVALMEMAGWLYRLIFLFSCGTQSDGNVGSNWSVLQFVVQGESSYHSSASTAVGKWTIYDARQGTRHEFCLCSDMNECERRVLLVSRTAVNTIDKACNSWTWLAGTAMILRVSHSEWATLRKGDARHDAIWAVPVRWCACVHGRMRTTGS